MTHYPNARLLLSAAAASQFPADEGVEVAIAGRSNAGKSTAINALTGRKALARTSKQPGRTRLLNFFELSAGTRLVDLPGYGYAQGARAERDLWSELIDALRPRRSLYGVLLVVDARRGLGALDEQLLAWAQGRPRAIHVLLSKADQLSRGAARECLQTTQQQLGAVASVQLFSARAGTGVEEARALLQRWLRAPQALQTPQREGDVNGNS